jgi:5-(carboxyamino)imidazole ribonucleotide mutase
MKPVVALLMGSDSDLPRLEPCLERLRELGIAHEARVLSAHRTPEAVARYVQDAPGRGIRVLLCAAGGAAHLAGVVAAHTTLPVIGIPIDNPPLGGLDALLSTVQMPGGVPVGTLAIGEAGAKNAGLLAVRCLAGRRPELRQKLHAFHDRQRDAVLRDAELA